MNILAKCTYCHRHALQRCQVCKKPACHEHQFHETHVRKPHLVDDIDRYAASLTPAQRVEVMESMNLLADALDSEEE